MPPRLLTLEEHYSSHLVAAEDDLHTMLPQHVQDGLHDLDELRVKSLEAGKIQLQVISHVAAFMTVEESRNTNNELAEACKKHPSRLAAWAALPMQDPTAAVAELDRAVNELGFVGALINNHLADGTMYDDKKYWPVFQRAVELDVPVYIHPAYPGSNMEEHYKGNFSKPAAVLMSTASFGWHSECGLHVLRLFAAGLFDEYPTLKLGIGHCGELLPYMLERTIRSSGHWNLKRNLRTVFDENIWITTSGMFALPPLELLTKTVPVDKIMYSVDYPFSTNETGLDFVERIEKAGIFTLEQFEGFCHGNAEKFLKIKI